MNLSLQSQLELFPLTIRPDQKHFIVEENLSGEFYEMPQLCVDAIEQMNQGETLERIEKNLKTSYPDESVDVLAFVEQLVELGLVKTIDGKSLEVSKQKQSPKGFTWIPASLGRLFFNKVMNTLYLLIICINVCLLIANPQLFPSYKDLFIFDAMMFNVLTFSAITLLLILIHEFGHILAVRSYDLPAKLGVGHRLLFVVFETDLSLAWKLEKKQRNTLYTAGIFFDQVIIFIALLLKGMLPGTNTILTGILGIVILDIFIKMIYQCCFYMKTDLYYLFENSTGCYNLMENGRAYLRKWFPFIKQDGTTETFEGEEKTVRVYSIFYICGVVLTLSLFLSYFIPQAIYAYARIFPELLQPGGNPYFWDALVFLGQTLIMITLLLYSMWKKRLENIM